jgi:LysM repeat protein
MDPNVEYHYNILKEVNLQIYHSKNKKTDKLNKILSNYKITIKNLTPLNNIDKNYKVPLSSQITILKQ